MSKIRPENCACRETIDPEAQIRDLTWRIEAIEEWIRDTRRNHREVYEEVMGNLGNALHFVPR